MTLLIYFVQSPYPILLCLVNEAFLILFPKCDGAAHEWGTKRSNLPKICNISYNDETCHSYTLPKEDPKNS